MNVFKRTEDVALAKVTSYAIVSDDHTTIIHINDQNPTQIDMHHQAGRQVGKGYHAVSKEEILPLLQRIHVHSGDCIYQLIANENRP